MSDVHLLMGSQRNNLISHSVLNNKKAVQAPWRATSSLLNDPNASCASSSTQTLDKNNSEAVESLQTRTRPNKVNNEDNL